MKLAVRRAGKAGPALGEHAAHPSKSSHLRMRKLPTAEVSFLLCSSWCVWVYIYTTSSCPTHGPYALPSQKRKSWGRVTVFTVQRQCCRDVARAPTASTVVPIIMLPVPITPAFMEDCSRTWPCAWLCRGDREETQSPALGRQSSHLQQEPTINQVVNSPRPDE